MGNTDSIPVISQAKSGFQALAGDKQGARETQMNFLMGCPVVSQLGAASAAIVGNTKYARKSQKYFVGNMSAMADSIPVVGHVKGGIHYVCGDKEGGDNAMKASSRTVGVIGGGIGGFVVGGPVGSVVGGIAGGAAMDGIITGVDSAVQGKYAPSGHINFATRAIKGELDAGGYFDWIMTPVFDGVAGRAYAKVYQSIRARIVTSRNLKAAIKQAVENGEITVQEGESITSLAEQIKSVAKEIHTDAKGAEVQNPVVGSVVIDVEGNAHAGYSFKLRQALGSDGFGGDVPSAQQILNDRLPGRAPVLRGASEGQPACGEIHALHKHHKVNGVNSPPARTISVIYDPKTKSTFAVGRCGSCSKVGRYVNMGEVPTDAINGTVILSEEASLQASLDLLAPCECEAEEHDHDKKD